MNTTVYVFIDASNLWQAQKTKGILLDMKKLKDYLRVYYQADTLRIYYYDAYPEIGTRSYSTANKHAFYTALQKRFGYIVRKKPLKQIKAKDGSVFEKGNMDVELTIDAVASINSYDVAVIFSGDSDFLQLLTFIRNHGKKAYVVSSKNNISSELLTGGDGYTDIMRIREDIWGKPLAYRDHKK